MNFLKITFTMFTHVLQWIRDTLYMYSFKFAKSNLRPQEIWDSFAQSLIRPLSFFLTQSFIYNSISPVLNSPWCQKGKMGEIKTRAKISLYTVTQICTNVHTYLPIFLDCRDITIYVGRKVAHILTCLNKFCFR